jgi:hypothetical protein
MLRLRSTRLLTVLLVAALASCVGPRSGAAVDVRTAVQHYYDVLSARDWQAYRRCFWPAATLTTVWQPPGSDAPAVVTTTIDEFLAHTAEGPGAQPIFEERLLAAEVILANTAKAIRYRDWPRRTVQIAKCSMPALK